MPSLNATAIAEIIARLLSHFATADEPLAVRREIAADWLDDLAEFTPGQVQTAAKEWRQMESRRPAIADIRKLATQAQHRDLEAKAIAGPRELDADTLRMWSGAEYYGDFRSPVQRRAAAIEAQEERYRRGAAWRAGKLDEYDAVHHPERLAARRAVQPDPPITAGDLGVSASEQAAE